MNVDCTVISLVVSIYSFSFSNENHSKHQVTVSYFFIDLVWVALVPNCVKSPDVIIKVRCFGIRRYPVRSILFD